MNLPLGTLKSTEEWEHAKPMDCLSRVDLNFSGVIRFFERGIEWNIFFLLFEEGSLIGYYAIRGNTPLEGKLYTTIERFEVEVRSFTETEMKIARTLNAESLLPVPMKLQEKPKEELDPISRVSSLFPDESFVAEIQRAKKFRENFLHRKMIEMPSHE